MPPNVPSLRLPTVIVVAATVLALVSAWHSGRHMWHRLDGDYHTYAAYTGVQRRHAPLTMLGLDGAVFDWYSQYVARGDRVYYQVLPSGLGTMAPERREEINALGLKSIVSGTLTTCLMGAVVGVLT